VPASSSVQLQFQDPEGYPVSHYDLWYSPDAGETWDMVTGGITSHDYLWSAPSEVTESALLELVAYDESGLMGSYLSNAFEVLYGITGVDDEPRPERFALRFAGRSPAQQAALQFGMPAAGQVTVRVYDVRGALVRELANGTFEPGWHRVTWDGTGATGSSAKPGVYFVQALANGERLLRRFVLLK
jgi:hypothetical protein